MKVPQEKLIEMYTMLSRIRKVELEIEEHYKVLCQNLKPFHMKECDIKWNKKEKEEKK